ncbi:hypothetical protein GGR50DRAFT_688895 [Xylaria sp. CBS 124048]|nr:hypothetical protein GGR50DRAFT_688895 [Xylaria sp. CBS 124048]
MAPPPGPLPGPTNPPSGHAKKQNPAPAAINRHNVVLAAIPLPFMNKQSNGTKTTVAKSQPEHAPNASTSNDSPVSSLEVALLRKLRGPANDAVEGQNTEKSEHASMPPSTYEKQNQASVQQENGTGPANTDSNVDAGHGAEKTQVTNAESTYAFQSKPAISTAEEEPALTFHAPAHPMPHQQQTVDHHHPTAFHAQHQPFMHPYQHAHQMSNGGGILFGGYDSHTPSPAPLSGAFLPPPHPPMNGDSRGLPRANGHHHVHSNSSGFPGTINTNFRDDMVPISTMDAYGMVPAPAPPVHMDSFAPGAGRYGPPTPHSFHGSHTSGEPNGMENISIPYHPSGSYAHARYEHSGTLPHPPGLFPPYLPPQPMARQFNAGNDELMLGIHYIRSLFNNADLSDCALELVYVNGHRPPVKITGHSLMFARSPALKQFIQDARTGGHDPKTIVIETHDAFLRSDAWWTAVQHLYLYQHQLPQLRHPIPGNAGNGMDFAGDNRDRFDFCLGYAAAGYTLGMQDILIRGLETAANTLTWDSLETGLSFVLKDTIQVHFDHSPEPEEASHCELEFGYGPETKILLAGIVNFLVNEFPTGFELDTSILDTPKLARIPMNDGSIPITAPTVCATQTFAPAIARGTNTRPPLKQARLSSIKFGDLPAAYPDGVYSPLAQQEYTKHCSILSLILLNLPYDQLCHVLTSGSNGVSSWNTAQDRYHAVVEVVAEREARRLRAVEAVRSEAISQALEIQARLSAPHRYKVAEPWDVLNWQEEVVRADTPRIVRKWVPQFDVARQQPARQTPPRLHDVPDSMV